MAAIKCVSCLFGLFALLGCGERLTESDPMESHVSDTAAKKSDLTIEDIKSMPKGIHVIHTPNVVEARESGNPDTPYRWEHKETVIPLIDNLTIQEFGYIVVVDGVPRLHSYNWDGRPYDKADFVDFFECEDGPLKKGQGYTRTDWTENEFLEKSEMTTYFVGKDEKGTFYSGYSEVTKLPRLKGSGE